MFATAIPLELKHSVTSLSQNKQKEAAYYITKTPTDHLLPSWMGFNQF